MIVKDYQDARRWLKTYGYLPTVPLSELERLDDRSAELRHGAGKAQCAMYTQDQMGFPDGVVGPRTLAAMNLPRCGHPDFPDQDLVAANPLQVGELLKTTNAPALIDAHQKLARNMAVGSGSWPMPCQKEGTTVSVDYSQSPSPVGLDRDQFWKITRDIWWRVGWHLRLETGSQRANIRMYWRRFGGSTIGMAQFNSQSCSDSVYCTMSTSYYYPSLVQHLELTKHELGHTNNLPHTSGGTMNPTIQRVATIEDLYWSRSDPSWPRIVRFNGGEPVDVRPPPTPPGPGPPPVPTGTGTGVMVFDGEPYDCEIRLKSARPPAPIQREDERWDN